jgi:hypothetical protein
MNLPEFRVYAVGEDYASPGPPEGGTLAGTVHGQSPRGRQVLEDGVPYGARVER